jgi:hypothetical protein
MNIATIDWISTDNKKKPIGSTAKDHFHFCGGNTGNLVHLNAYEKVLSNHSLNSCQFSDADFINSQHLLLIKCANQIGKHFNPSDMLLSFIEQIDIPIIMCSLGIQYHNFNDLDILPQDTRWPELLKIISSKRISDYPNISVRGEYSQRVLNYYGVESTVTGCVSTSLFEDNLGTILKNKYKDKKINSVCVAGNNPYNEVSTWLEKELKLITEEYNGVHIAQSPLEIFKLIHGENIEIPDSFLKTYDMSREELRRWFIRYGKMFYNTDDWSSVMKLYDLVIGTRYHGIAMGLQNEIIGTVFAIDSRTKELAITNGIKHIDVNLLKNKNYKEILEMSMWQEDDYSYLDQQVNYCKNQLDLFFNQNGVKLKYNNNPIFIGNSEGPLIKLLNELHNSKYIRLDFDKNSINHISKYDSLKTDKNSILIKLNYDDIVSTRDIEERHVQDINIGITKVFVDYSNESGNEEDLISLKNILYSKGIKNFENIFLICQNRLLKNNSHSIKILNFDYFLIDSLLTIKPKIDDDYIEKIINSIHNNTTKYDILCLNATPRPHRLVLLLHMFHRGIDFKKNLISFPGYTYSKDEEFIQDWRSQALGAIMDGTRTNPNLIDSLALLEQYFPLIVDDTKGQEGNDLAFIVNTDSYLNSKISIVTETAYHPSNYRITEKTIKPLLLGHPLYVFGHPGTLNIIEDLGFRVVEPEVQQKIDNENNINKKCELIIDATMEFLKNYESLEFREKVKEVVLHNMQWGREGFISKYYTDYIKILWQEIAGGLNESCCSISHTRN